MLMTNFLKNRESTRDFKSDVISKETLEKVVYNLREIEKEHDNDSFKFTLHENGRDVYEGLDGKAGYSGVMIESPHYISVRTDGNDKEVIYGAYAMEKLITRLHDLGIATCWITLDDVEESIKKNILGEENGSAIYMLAIGYPKRKSPFAKESTSDRKSVEEIVYKGEIGNVADLDELENRGLLDAFYYVRYAPSTKNLQPCRFLVDGNEITLLQEEENMYLADAGIMMYYFEALANILGVRSTWEMLDGKVESGYRHIAKFKM